MHRPTCVYRIFDKAGGLLYIGCSEKPNMRICAHTKLKPWATEMASVTLQWFDDEKSAFAAEREAIRTEVPEWNVLHHPAPKFSVGLFSGDFDRQDPSTWVRKRRGPRKPYKARKTNAAPVTAGAT